MKPWTEIATSPEFLNADPAQQETLRRGWIQSVLEARPDIPPEVAGKLIGRVYEGIAERPKLEDFRRTEEGKAEAILDDLDIREKPTLGGLPSPLPILRAAAEATIPGAEHVLSAEGRRKFSQLSSAEQSLEILKTTAETELMLGGGYILKGLGYLGKHILGGILKSSSFVRGATEWVDNTWFGRNLRRISHHLEKDPAGEALLHGPDGIMRVQADGMAKAGLWQEILNVGGVYSLPKKLDHLLTQFYHGLQRRELLSESILEEVKNLSPKERVLFKRAADAWDKVADIVFDEFVSVGGKVKMPNGSLVEPKKIANYLPLDMEMGVKRALGKDVHRFAKIVRQLANQGIEGEELFKRAYTLLTASKRALKSPTIETIK